MKVKELNLNERPREKALQLGFDILSNRDLIAILLASGTKGTSALELADKVLSILDHIGSLRYLKLSELMSIKGIKEAKALTLLAAVELCKRMSEQEMKEERIQIEHPDSLVKWLKEQIAFESQEMFVAVFLNHANKIIHHEILFIGSDHASIISPKEVYRLAVSYGAGKLIVAHNHPSGTLKPSQSDLETTARLQEMGNMMEITLLDHLIISQTGYCSLRALGFIN